jgi:hypothetical protein
MDSGTIVGMSGRARLRSNAGPLLRGNKTLRLRVTDSSGATHSTVGPCAWTDSRSPDSADSTPSQSTGRAQGAQVSQPIKLAEGSVLKPSSTNSEPAISNGEGDLSNGTQFDAEFSPNTPGGAPRAGCPTTRAKTAVFAVVGACAVLFGASFAAAALTGDDEPEKAGPALSGPSAADTPSGRSLDLGGVARLPGLREQPSPEPGVAHPMSAASPHVPEPASSSEPEPAAPPPEPVSSPEPAAPAPEPVAPAPQPVPPEPQAVVSPEPQPGTQPSRPAPQPAQPAPIEVYDSGG